ncbi:MAG: hypothetical protein WAX14_23140 [Rhodococcus sp. (in: high G+C Gram-positive bacteria)]|uniref:hypothetical protein n=1 Tax=Rhodococcus sp. TaxID=1831 RepID=UPI003BB74C57
MCEQLEVGDIVQRVAAAGVGTNQDRYTARVTAIDGIYAYLDNGRWFDVYGNGHDIDTPGKIHTGLLRKLYT